jgi:hypothetical protein
MSDEQPTAAIKDVEGYDYYFNNALKHNNKQGKIKLIQRPFNSPQQTKNTVSQTNNRRRSKHSRKTKGRPRKAKR